jgi:hypothetical protein
LSGALRLALLGAAVSVVAFGQIEREGPIHLSNVEGYVVNSKGKPVADAEVTLSQDEKVVLSTRTDRAGAFRFEHADGHFVFRVGRTMFAPAEREILVRVELATAVARKKLYVIVGPGACADACSSVSTSRREFDRVISENSKH